MVAWVALLLLAAAPDAGLPMPSARELAQSFFVAGDLKRAVDAGRQCLVIEGHDRCEPFYRALVEYKGRVPDNEHLTPAEAREYLEWDHVVSPNARGKLTEGVYRRFVTDPLEATQRLHVQGESAKALEMAQHVLEVEPHNDVALKLIKTWTAQQAHEARHGSP